MEGKVYRTGGIRIKMTTAQTIGGQEYPQEFNDWMRRKISAQELAMLAATLSNRPETFQTAVPTNTWSVNAAIELLFQCWKRLKGREDSLAKAEPES
jgi:macrodomain Ter protein organizer (MatP/YcbG family)